MFADFSALTTQQWTIVILIVGACFTVSILTILDIWKRRFRSAGEKSIWMQIAIFIPVLGALAYFFIGRNNGSKVE